jgi:prokaryotic ubiquitin-like protein Pup
MAERIQKKVPAPQERTSEDVALNAAVDEEAASLKAETDDLLDEIDALLEENAEEFVRGYVQKGGE